MNLGYRFNRDQKETEFRAPIEGKKLIGIYFYGFCPGFLKLIILVNGILK